MIFAGMPDFQDNDIPVDDLIPKYRYPENLRYYIDYDAIARDMKINGEIVEIKHDLIVTNANEF